MWKTRTYRVWASMKDRCLNRKSTGFSNYGGRGITVCKKWRKFEGFFADMGEAPEGLSIERIDNSRGYEPGNCRWATPREQMRNTRRNHYVACKGKKQTLSEWARDLGVSRH